MESISQELRQAVLQSAIQGKLTQQLPSDGNARDLLVCIKNDRKQKIENGIVKKDKRLDLSFTDEPLFDIPDNWVWTTLGSLLYKLTDGTHKTPKYTSDGVKFVSVKDISTGKLSLDNTKYISNDEHKELFKRCNPEFGDMLLTKVGTTGVPAIVDTKEPFSLFVSVALLKYNHDFILDKYFYYLLWSPLVQQQAKEKTKGIGNQNWVLDKITKTSIVLPPLAEQHRIVARVEELMAKIDELEKAENELRALHQAFPDDMKSALIQASLQGKLTEQLPSDGSTRDLLKQIKIEKEQLVKAKKLNKDVLDNAITDEPPFDIPDNWEWICLKGLVCRDIRRGKSPKYGEGKSFAFAQKCNSKYDGIRLDLALSVTDSFAERFTAGDEVQDGDIIINSTGNGTLGRIGYFESRFNPNGYKYYPDSHIAVVRCLKVNSKYILTCLRYYQDYLESKGEGSTNQKELKPDTIKNLMIPLPPLAEQERIVEKLDKLLPLCDSLKTELY